MSARGVDGAPGGGRRASPGDVIVARIRVPARALGFTPPPARVDLVLFPRGAGWSGIVKGVTAETADLSAWLLENGGELVLAADRVESVIAHVRFLDLPAECRRMVQHATLKWMRFDADGTLCLTFEGERALLKEWVQRAADGTLGAPAVESVTRAREGGALLTPRQRELLLRATAEGYYDVPRKLNLVALAEKCAMSPGALSETLRRAEARVVESFMARGKFQ